MGIIFSLQEKHRGKVKLLLVLVQLDYNKTSN